jgi:peptidoglycan/LPS O-acetylase OafA/YrhL
MVLFVMLAIKLLGLSPFSFSFMLGVLLARHVGWIRSRWPGLPFFVKGLVLAAAVVLYCHAFTLPPTLTRQVAKWLIDLTALGSALFLVIALGSGSVQALLNKGALRFMGKISYGFYLTHLMLLLCFTPYVFHFLRSLGVHNAYLLFAGGAGAIFAATVALSYLTYHTVEQPGIRLGKWFTRHAAQLVDRLLHPKKEPGRVEV